MRSDLQFTKGTVASDCFGMRTHNGHGEANFVAKIGNRFEVIQACDHVPSIGTEIEVVRMDDAYPSYTKKGEAPIARYSLLPQKDIERLKAE